MTQDTPIDPRSLYHFCVSVYEYGAQNASIDGLIQSTITSMEDYEKIKNMIRDRYKLKESEKIVITSLTKLS